MGFFSGCCFIVFFVFSSLCLAEERKAKIELGVGGVSQVLADYRGSKHYGAKVVPLPYMLYSGKFFKLDRNGARSELINNARYKLNVSVDASLSANDGSDGLRESMPELDSTLEFGPSLDVNLTGADLKQGWSLRLPVRAVFAVNTKMIDHVGYLFNPRLTWRKPDFWGQWRTSINLGALWADGKYHSYYYEVSDQFVTENRALYNAHGGYSGAFFKVSFYKEVEAWRFGVALRYDNLTGSVFEESPLVETKSYGSLSVGVARRFWSNF